MPYIVVKHPVIKIDLMVLEEFWPLLAAHVQRTGCGYSREDKTELPNGRKYIVLRDVRADKEHQLGELLGLLYSLEWNAVTSPDGEPRRFYILIKPRKKGKKHVHQEHREEAGTGSAEGNSGESGDNGQDPGDCESGNGDRPYGADICQQLEIPGVFEADDNNNQ